MSLLTIIQDSLKEIPGLEVPTTIVGNENQTAVLSLALANRALKQIRVRSNFNETNVRQTITTVNGQEEYAIPSGFGRILSVTWWDLSNRWPMFGPASAAEWEALKSRIVQSSIRRIWRLFRSETSTDNVLHIFPTPTVSGESLTYEFVTRAVVEDTSGNLTETFLNDTDVALISEDVIAAEFKWRFLKSKGLPYAEELRDAETLLADLISQDGGGIIDFIGNDDRDNRDPRRLFIVQEGNFPG